MKILLSIILLLAITHSFSQQSISVEMSAEKLSNDIFNTITLTHQQEVSDKFLWSAGIMMTYREAQCISLDKSFSELLDMDIKAPYEEVDQSLTDSLGTHNLIAYTSDGLGVGFAIGMGYFKNFNDTHGIRLNAKARIMHSDIYINAIYFSNDFIGPRSKTYYSRLLSLSVTLEAYYTIRVNDKFSLCYGAKFPYFFATNRDRFNPESLKEIFYGLEPELAFGVIIAM